MNDDELLSVVVPVHNTPVHIFEKCIESIFCQKYQMLDVVVIDDGSEEKFSKGYVSIACKYPRRVRLFKKAQGGYHLHVILD